jgi:ADP-heptose:LPS heptosyltransferase
MTTPASERAQVWGQAAHLLCIRLDNMGDVLMSTPALRALKSVSRGGGVEQSRRLTLLASESGAALARHIPEIDAVVAYQAPWMKASTAHPAALDRALIRRLARARFDGAVIFTCHSQSPLPAALLCSLAGIPLTLAHCRENPYALLSDWVPEREPQSGVRHEVQRQIDLVAAIGAVSTDTRLSFRLDEGDRATVRWKLALLGLAGSEVLPAKMPSYVVMHPGATASSRRYAPDRFAAVARALVRKLKVPILITGSAAERSLAEHIVRDAGRGALNVAGMLSLGELAALICDASLLVSNNTGPVHIAAALGTPVVDLYALTNPQHTPWQVAHRVLNRDVACRDCYKSVCPQGTGACLDVAPDEVVAAAFELASKRATGNRSNRISISERPCLL